MKQVHRTIQPRRRYFLACEGESEQSYGTLLRRFADIKGLRIHIEVMNLSPAGDSLVLAEKALAGLKREARRGVFEAWAILLDQDKADELPLKAASAQRLLDREGFLSIWQHPDHEGLLLRHIAGRERDNPPRGHSGAALRTQWPAYRKNMPANDLQKLITLEDVLRAAVVIPGLDEFVAALGLTAI